MFATAMIGNSTDAFSVADKNNTIKFAQQFAIPEAIPSKLNPNFTFPFLFVLYVIVRMIETHSNAQNINSVL